jgi:hypothetical protein
MIRMAVPIMEQLTLPDSLTKAQYFVAEAVEELKHSGYDHGNPWKNESIGRLIAIASTLLVEIERARQVAETEAMRNGE